MMWLTVGEEALCVERMVTVRAWVRGWLSDSVCTVSRVRCNYRAREGPFCGRKRQYVYLYN